MVTSLFNSLLYDKGFFFYSPFYTIWQMSVIQDSDWAPFWSGLDAAGCSTNGSNHRLKSSTHCQSFILHHNVLLSLHLNHFLHIVMTSLDFVRPNTRGNIRRKGSTLDNGQERMWELPGRVKLILGDRRLQSSAFCSSPSCWYGKMHVRLKDLESNRWLSIFIQLTKVTKLNFQIFLLSNSCWSWPM